MSEPDFAGRVAVVTGGSRGIGAGIAMALARCGAQVVVNGRDADALARVVRAIEDGGGQALAAVANVTDGGALAELRAQAQEAFGPVSLLVANAGGGGRPEPLAQMSEERWREALETNLTSAFLTLKTFLPAMMEARSGAVVTISSVAGRQPSGASAAYAAAKAGLLSLTRQAAAEAAPSGVRVNAVAPSSIVTERMAAQPETVRQQIAQGFPLRRLGKVDDVAEAALFLLGEGAGWITGVTLDVAGGRVML
ncbi:MAG: SDR family NAD(P)-dependent oxidoreductase [Caulobacterales bacterium]|jgi:3-oxoacyl-[acyl-carrier protein] reductase